MASTPSFALSQLWPSLSGTAQDKIAQVNAMAVAGPNVDVSIQQVAGYLLLQGIYPTIAAFALTSPTSDATHDGALTAAKTFMAWIALPDPPPVHMSQPDVFTAVNQLGGAMLAQETASKGSTGFTQAVLDGLLALGQTSLSWWQANGFSGPITAADAVSAGLA